MTLIKSIMSLFLFFMAIKSPIQMFFLFYHIFLSIFLNFYNHNCFVLAILLLALININLSLLSQISPFFCYSLILFFHILIFLFFTSSKHAAFFHLYLFLSHTYLFTDCILHFFLYKLFLLFILALHLYTSLRNWGKKR